MSSNPGRLKLGVRSTSVLDPKIKLLGLNAAMLAMKTVYEGYALSNHVIQCNKSMKALLVW